VGALHDATGGWDAPLWLMAAVMLLGIPAGLFLARPGSVEDAWERRHGRPW
jgi:MFS transporter, CP family, cyanate transporter